MALAVLFAAVNWPMDVNDGRMNQREEYIMQLLGAQRTEEALRLLAATEARHPRPGLLLCRVGLMFRQQGNEARALEFFERAFSVDRGDPRIRLNLGEALFNAGRAMDALPHLQAVQASGLSPSTTRYDLAMVYHALGRADLAREQIASIHNLDELAAEGLLVLGQMAMILEAPGDSERFLREAVRRLPQDARSHHQLGVLLAMQQNLAEAVAELDQAVRLDPDDADASFHLAVALTQSGRVAEARTRLQRALQLRPDFADAKQLQARISGLR
jgi:Flp pilus assembly protein TadD